jgi:hypothetical protein
MQQCKIREKQSVHHLGLHLFSIILFAVYELTTVCSPAVNSACKLSHATLSRLHDVGTFKDDSAHQDGPYIDDMVRIDNNYYDVT